MTLSHAPRLILLAAGLALAACSSHGPDRVADKAHDTVNPAQATAAIPAAEQAVMTDSRNPGLRLALANAYLRAGRFQSARQTYADAIELGDDSSRAALGLVMADLALGHNAAALDTVNTYGDVLNAADLGLALVMAGQNQRGIDVLTTAIRNGQNTPKMRQNLAYAYALSNMWPEARIMVAQDVPAAQIDARLQSWATMQRPEDARRRVATLTGAPMVDDPGQPTALALAHAPAPVQQAAAELPPVASQPVTPSGALERVALPPARPVMTAVPVVQPIPAQPPAPRAVAAVVPHAAAGTHLVQLGAFNSEESARRAWQHYSTRNPRLAGHPSLITHVTVNGREFWRVQATGFAGRAVASAMCGTMKAQGGACMVMAAPVVAPVQKLARR
jgi:Flp pilus assembly protein TadD